MVIICSLFLSTAIISATNENNIWSQYQSHGGMSLSVFLYEFQQIPINSVEYRQAAIVSYFLSVHGSI